MMHVTVSSVTLDTLRAFRQRRSRLILLRGICATIVTLVVAMSAISLLDFLLVVPDKLRWVLSGSGYVLTLAVAWLSCLRPLLRMPSDRQLARLVEATRPELREDLLSAVELGMIEGGEETDSPVFRQLLQQSVATRVTGLRAAQLLPWRLVRGWLIGAAALLVAVVILMAVPGSPFRLLLARACLPAANVGRLSQVTVTIVEPTPHDAIVPQNESLPIVVEITGPGVEKVTAETRSASGETRLVALEATPTDARYSGRLDVGAEPFEYRVLAGDAVTQFYRVTPRPRPFIATFVKTYHYPAYAGMAEKSLSEPQGHLEALEGTTVDLQLHSNQQVQAGELEVNTGESRVTVPLTVSNSDTLSGRLTLKNSGTYTVRVVAADTQFVNRLSPQYDIKVVPDLPPHVELTAPADHALLAPEDVVVVQGRATDDLGLASIEQEIRVNERPAVRQPLAKVTGRSAKIRQAWDLMPLKLVAGDRVVTKLLATDRKGNVGESTPITATVVSAGFSAARLASLEAQKQVADELRQLLAAVQRQRDLSLKALNPKGKAEVPDSQQKLDRFNVVQGHEQLPRDVERARHNVAACMSKVSVGAEAHGLLAAGYLLTGVQYEVLARSPALFDRATTAKTPAERGRYTSDLAANYRQAEDILTRGLQNMELLIADESIEIAQDMLHDLARQPLIPTSSANSTADAQEAQRERLVRKISSTLQQCGILDHLIRDSATVLRDKNLPPIIQPLTAQCAALDELLANPGATAPLVEKTAALDRAIAQASTALQPACERIGHVAFGGRDELTRRSGLWNNPIADLGRPWQDAINRRRAVAEPAQKQQYAKDLAPARAAAAQAHEQLTLVDGPAALERLAARMELESARRDADWRYVADLGLAYRALSDLLERYAAQDDFAKPDATKGVESFNRLRELIAFLAAAHDVSVVVRAERDLASRERWSSQTAAAHTLHPRQWQFALVYLDAITPQIRFLAFSRETLDLLGAIPKRPYYKVLDEEMTRRRRSPLPPASVIEPLSQWDTDLYAVLQLMLPKLTEARQSLEKLAPTPIQMLRHLAVRTQQIEQESRTAIKESGEQPLTKQAASASAKLATVRQKMGVALSALKVDANLRDLLTQQGRDFARDVDDAVMTLNVQADHARDANASAQQAEQPSAQRELLGTAADRDHDLAVALNETADHFERLEHGDDVTPSRDKLRAEEVKQDRRTKIEEREAKLADFGHKADLAASDPRKLLEELEQELKQNRLMHGELDEITRQLLRQARADLTQAATLQRQSAGALAKAAECQEAIKANIVRAGMAVARAARHERRLENILIADTVQAIAQDIAGAVVTELAELGKKLSLTPQPPTLNADALHCAESIQQQADRIGRLLNEPDATDTASAPDKSAGKTPKPPAKPDPMAADNAPSEQAPPPKTSEQTAAKAAEALQKQRDPETSKWLARALDELDESLTSETEKKKYESLTATAADKKDEPMTPQPPGDKKPQGPMPPKPKSDEQVEAKDHENPPMPPSPPGDSKADGPGNGNSGTGPGGPPVPGLKPPKGKAKKAKGMFFESTELLGQEIDQERSDEDEEVETKDDPGESLGSGGSAGPAGSHRPHGALSAVDRRETGAWGKLPPQTARDLSDGSRQEVEGEYKQMVESYFRSIAERAKETRKP